MWISLQDSLKQGLANYGPWAKSSSPLAFVIKVLLGTQPHPFIYLLSMAAFML